MIPPMYMFNNIIPHPCGYGICTRPAILLHTMQVPADLLKGVPKIHRFGVIFNKTWGAYDIGNYASAVFLAFPFR